MMKIPCALLALLVFASPLQARDLRDDTGPRMAFGGLAVGAMGFLAGFHLGRGASDDSDQSLGDLRSGYNAGSAVGAVALGLGVHLADYRQGDLAKTVLASLLVGAAGVGAVHATDTEGLMIPTVLLQLVVASHVERRAARADRAPAVRVGLWRPREGGTGPAVTVSF